MEPVEAVVGTELLRTVVSTIVLGEVAAIVVIGGTESPVLTIVREVTAVGILRTVEHTHGGHIMLTELAGVIDLSLIEQIAHGGSVVDRTTCCGPEDTLLEVKVCIALQRLRIDSLSGRGVNPFLLCIMIEVVNASSIFLEHVIPTDERTGRETGRDEVELLRQRKVGVDTRCSMLLSTREGQIHHRVGRALRVSRIVAPGAITVSWDKGIVRCAVGCLPELALTKGSGGSAPRSLALTMTAEEVHL